MSRPYVRKESGACCGAPAPRLENRDSNREGTPVRDTERAENFKNNAGKPCARDVAEPSRTHVSGTKAAKLPTDFLHECMERE